MSTFGPISTALEAQLRKQVQQNGIVIWLDRDGHDQELVDRLQNLRTEEQLPSAMHGFRGSQLALMVDLAAFSLGALDEAEGRAVVCEQGLQGGLFGASGASQPGSMEQRGSPSC
jgi:hypothetical protein